MGGENSQLPPGEVRMQVQVLVAGSCVSKANCDGDMVRTSIAGTRVAEGPDPMEVAPVPAVCDSA